MNRIIRALVLGAKNLWRETRLFRHDACPQCQTGTLQEFIIHSTPPNSWTLWQCCECGTDYVREAERLFLRTEWAGPLIVEHIFLMRDNPEADPNELWDNLEASTSATQDNQA